MIQKLLTLLLCVTILLGCNENFKENFNTKKDARDAIRKGWVPDIIPASSFEIHERHNLDTNSCQGSFLFKAESSDTFKDELSAYQIEQSSIKKKSLKVLEGDTFYKVNQFIISVDWSLNKGRFLIEGD